MQTIRLTTCDNIQEAAILKGRLKNEGIESMVTNENFTTMLPHFNGMLGAGAQLLVAIQDYERAAHILELNKPPQSEIICPYCNSSNIKYGLGRHKTGKIFAMFLSILAFSPFNNIKNLHYCKDCKSDFKT